MMVETLGGILNWLAAGVAFPLMLAPLALLVTPHGATRLREALTYLAIIAGLAASGLAFVFITPSVDYVPTASTAVTFAALTTTVAIAVWTLGGVENGAERGALFCRKAVRMIGRGAMWLLIAMALVQFSIVLARYVFGVNSIFVQQSVIYMHAAAFLLTAGYAVVTDDHVRVDILYRGANEQRRALLDFLGAYLFLFPFCLLIFWTSSRYVGVSWSVREGSTEASGIQGVFLLKSLIPAFALFVAMGGYALAHDAAIALRHRAER